MEKAALYGVDSSIDLGWYNRRKRDERRKQIQMKHSTRRRRSKTGPHFVDSKTRIRMNTNSDGVRKQYVSRAEDGRPSKTYSHLLSPVLLRHPSVSNL